MWVQFLQEAQEVTKSCVPFSDRVTFLGSMKTRFLSFSLVRDEQLGMSLGTASAQT